MYAHTVATVFYVIHGNELIYFDSPLLTQSATLLTRSFNTEKLQQL